MWLRRSDRKQRSRGGQEAEKGHLEAAKKLSSRADALSQGTTETGTKQEEGSGMKGWIASSILDICFQRYPLATKQTS